MEVLLKYLVRHAGCSRGSQVHRHRQYQYPDVFLNIGMHPNLCYNMAVPSKSLWLFYLICQLFLKPIKRDKFLFNEIFLLKRRPPKTYLEQSRTPSIGEILDLSMYGMACLF